MVFHGLIGPCGVVGGTWARQFEYKFQLTAMRTNNMRCSLQLDKHEFIGGSSRCQVRQHVKDGDTFRTSTGHVIFAFGTDRTVEDNPRLHLC